MLVAVEYAEIEYQQRQDDGDKGQPEPGRCARKVVENKACRAFMNSPCDQPKLRTSLVTPSDSDITVSTPLLQGYPVPRGCPTTLVQ